MTLIHPEIPAIPDDYPGFERWYALSSNGIVQTQTSTAAMIYLVKNKLIGKVMLDSKIHGRRITIRHNADGSWTPIDPVRFEDDDDYGEP